MFLSEKKSGSKDSKKGLSSLAIDNLQAPAHLSATDRLPASLQYRPDGRRPTRGATELTRDDRHSAHLRKKRVLKVERVRKDKLLRSLAQNNKKLRVRLEKQDALKTLGKQKNVQIIKSQANGNAKKNRETRK